jgi:hypothetical protein
VFVLMFRLARGVYPALDAGLAWRVFVRSLEGFGEESDRTFWGEKKKILKFPQSGNEQKRKEGWGEKTKYYVSW